MFDRAIRGGLVLAGCFLLLGMPQQGLAYGYIVTKHFVVTDAKSSSQARRIAEAAEQIRAFYLSAGFEMPKGRYRLPPDKRRMLISVWNSDALPGSISIPHAPFRVGATIQLAVRSIDTQKDIFLNLAHELAHHAIYKSFSKVGITRLLGLWVGIKATTANPCPDDEAEFWLFFEGIPETLAWLMYPRRAASAGTSVGLAENGRYWFAPDRSGGACAVPRPFMDPWRILPACGPARDLETIAYKTTPFWLGVAQRTASGNSPLAYAKAIREIVLRVDQQLARDVFDDINLLHTDSVPAGIRKGINAYLRRFNLSRDDLRDLMILSSGVERFHDHAATKYRIDEFRDYEDADNEQEDVTGFPTWVQQRTSIGAPTPASKIGFENAPTIPPERKWQLIETRYVDAMGSTRLPAFAGKQQGRGGGSHPIVSGVIPPGAIEFKDRRAADAVIHPVVVAGLRRKQYGDLSVSFPMRYVEVTDDPAGARLGLNNFRLRNLSIFRLADRDSRLQYRYLFLGPHEKSLRVSALPSAPRNPMPTRMLRLDDGEWVIRGVKPRASQHVSVMLTPAGAPKGKRKPNPCAATAERNSWCSDSFDVVKRHEDSTLGKWTTPSAASLWTHWAVITTPAPGSRMAGNTRTRVDIARVEPGNHGGGTFYLTAVDHDLSADPLPDLLVRAHGTAEGMSAAFPDIHIWGSSKMWPENGCNVARTIRVYITNQGSAEAGSVSAKLTGEISLTEADGQRIRRELPESRKGLGNLRPGETDVVEFSFGDRMPFGTAAAIRASVTLDPDNVVAEAMEANNTHDRITIDVQCRGPMEPPETDIDIGDIIDDLPANPQALIQLEHVLPSLNELFAERLKPLVAWLRGKASRPVAGSNPGYAMTLERLDPLVRAGVFQPEMLGWLAELAPASRKAVLDGPIDARRLRRALETWATAKSATEFTSEGEGSPEDLMLTPFGLLQAKGDGYSSVDGNVPLSFIRFEEDVPASLVVVDDLFSGFDTTHNGVLPMPPGAHDVRLIGFDGVTLKSWNIGTRVGETTVLDMK